MDKQIIIFKNSLYYLIGLGFLFLAKMKNFLQGYVTPKPFSDYDQCVNYDLQVVENWVKYLSEYTGSSFYLANKEILELGPGADLGIGLYLLFKGASRYNAIDVNNLVKTVPVEFYEKMFKKISNADCEKDILSLRDQLKKTMQGNNDRLNYRCRADFDIKASFKEQSIDIIFSQAAFEHFDDVEKTVSLLSAVAKKRAVIIAEIDLKTHSRWIRDVDPNNVYRYPEWIYDLFHFRGSPNRIRPFQYQNIFEKNGWENVKIIPESVISNQDSLRMCSGLEESFRDEKNQMQLLSIIICATKK